MMTRKIILTKRPTAVIPIRKPIVKPSQVVRFPQTESHSPFPPHSGVTDEPYVFSKSSRRPPFLRQTRRMWVKSPLTKRTSGRFSRTNFRIRLRITPNLNTTPGCRPPFRLVHKSKFPSISSSSTFKITLLLAS